MMGTYIIGRRTIKPTYIHYGHDKFDFDLFKPIKNKEFCNKPYGGLWASNTEAFFGWKKWCEDNDFRECKEENSFKFRLSDVAIVYRISSVKDMHYLPLVKDAFDHHTDFGIIRHDLFDFERIKTRYDAIEFNLSNDYDLYMEMYGWDCDSILVLNPEVIIPVPEDELWIEISEYCINDVISTEALFNDR